LTIGAIALTLIMIGSLFIQAPPQEAEPEIQTEIEAAAEEEGGEFGIQPISDMSGKEKKHRRIMRRKSFAEAAIIRRDSTGKLKPQVVEGMTAIEMLRTVQFWILFCFFALSLCAGFFVVGSYSLFAKRECSFEPDYGLVGGLGALTNASGRIFWGRMADWIDYRRSLFLNSTILGTFLFIYFEVRNSQVGYIIMTMAIYFCFGGFMPLFPSSAADAFGLKNVSQNYSILFFAQSVGSILQAALLSIIVNVIPMRILFYILGGFCFIAAFLAFAYKPPGKGKWFAIWLRYGGSPKKK
jgi:hypothetical protein